MSILSLGDLAVSYQQRLHSGRIRNDLVRLSGEMASGQRQDLRAATRGNLGVLAGLERQLHQLDSFRVAADEAALHASALQVALGTVQDAAADFAPGLLEAGHSASPPWIASAGAEARARFATVVSALNSSTAGRTLLAGAATVGPALAPAETMLADLAAAVAGETTATGVETAVTAWFDDAGGGFETDGYLGSAAFLQPASVGQGDSVRLEAKADDPQIRDTLKAFALAALVDAGALAGQSEEQATLLRRAGETMMTAQAGIATYRGGIGAAEAAIDTAQARNATATAALETARNDITTADPYETAVQLEAVRMQLDSLYTITARLSRLNLTEYLR